MHSCVNMFRTWSPSTLSAVASALDPRLRSMVGGNVRCLAGPAPWSHVKWVLMEIRMSSSKNAIWTSENGMKMGFHEASMTKGVEKPTKIPLHQHINDIDSNQQNMRIFTNKDSWAGTSKNMQELVQPPQTQLCLLIYTTSLIYPP